MLTTSPKRITDLTVRTQFYMEGVKAHMYSEVQAELDKLEVELFRIFSQSRFRDLSQVSKSDLNRLIVTLREAQGLVFGTTMQHVVSLIEDFTNASRVFQVRTWGNEAFKATMETTDDKVVSEEDALAALALVHNSLELETPYYGFAALGSASLMWSRVRNSINPGTGMTISQMIGAWSVSSQAMIENVVRRGYANGLTAAQIMDLVGGTVTPGSLGGFSSVNAVDRIKGQLGAVIDTAAQQATQQVSAGVLSTVSRQYSWLSVMDSKTTPICVSRNGKRYVYGSGPLPPAHYRCRSSIAPIVGGVQGKEQPNFKTWLDEQPAIVRDDIENSFRGSTSNMQVGALTVAQLAYRLQITNT